MGEGERLNNFDKLINPEKPKRFTWSKEKLVPVKWNDTEIIGFQYKFQFPNNHEREDGDAQVIYRNLEFFGQIKGDKLFTALTERGIKPTDVIVHINEFYPNGIGHIEKYERHGFGSEILDFLTGECEVNGAKLLYVITGKKKMKDFIKKHGFEPVDEKNLKNKKFFKILDKKN